jgi:hypothetical protein
MNIPGGDSGFGLVVGSSRRRSIMSTRSRIFYHNDQSAGIGIHIYTELTSDNENDVRLEIEHPNGIVNVPRPAEAFLEDMRKRI